MALIDLLKNDQSGTSFNGKKPPLDKQTVPLNPLSLIDSQLDLDGKIPADNYRDNAPEGVSF